VRWRPPTRSLVWKLVKDIAPTLGLLILAFCMVVVGYCKPAAKADCHDACQAAGYETGEYTGACTGDDCRCWNVQEQVPRP
jgi:hypothetical protein